jgi:hypothetical protein
MRKKIFLLSTTIVVGLISFTGCYYDKSEDVYPPAGPCDTTTMSYKTDIVGILSANCYRCHSTDFALAKGGNHILDQYDKLLPFATSGILEDVIEHVNVAPGLYMPQDGGKLSECDISKIKAWIKAGAHNN